MVIIVNSNDKQIGREREATITMDPKLFKAAMTGDLHFLESLNEDDNSNFLCQVPPKKNTVLHIAAEFNQLE